MAAIVQLYSRPESFEESSAPRRALAGGATEQLLGSARGSLAPTGRLQPSLHGCRASQPRLQEHSWRPSVRSLGLVAQEDPDAGRAVVALSASLVSVQFSVRGVQSPCVPVHVSSVQRPVRRPSVWVSNVWRPVSVPRRVASLDSPDGYHAVGIKPLASPCRPHDHRR